MPWITTKDGRHINTDWLKEKQDKDRNKEEADKASAQNESTQSYHSSMIKELSQSKYTDGTYDIETKTIKDFDNGYQVTFCQIGDNYTDAQYQQKVNECLKMSSDGKTYAGKFEGTPEISFHCADRKTAETYARANNQISIWDWKANKEAIEYEKAHPEDADGIAQRWMKCEISTGGTGKRRDVK